MAPSTPSSPPPLLHSSTATPTSTPTLPQGDIRRFLSLAMNITPPTPNIQPSSSHTNSGIENMETSTEDEESRKRRHSDDDSSMDIRSPGQGSLLTNTSIPIRQRLSAVSSSDPPTPDTIDQVMHDIRATSMQVTLPTIPDEDLNPDPNDHTTAANVIRVQEAVTGIVNLTRRVIHTETQDAMSWDHNDIGVPGPPLVSPMTRPNISTPPPTRSDSPGPEANMVDTLKDSFKFFFEEAYKKFEDKLLTTVSEYDKKMDAQSQVIKNNTDKINENTTGISNLDIRMSAIEKEVEALTMAKDQTNNDVQQSSAHIQRLDEGAQVVNNQLQLLQTLQSKVNELEAKISQGTLNPPPREEGNAGDILTPEELTKIRKKIQMDDDNYFFSTLQFKRFAPPRRGTDIRSRYEARQILKIIDAEDVISIARHVKFSSDLKSLRLTFDSPKVCSETLSHLSGLCSQIKRSGQQPGLHFAQLTPPRFSEQRQALYSMAKRMKEDNEITRFSFTMRNQTLCLRTGRQGYPDRIIPYKPTEHAPMETDQDSSCLICLQDLADGDIAFMDCKHVFHKLCLVTSLERTIGCPFCKAQTDMKDDLKCQKCIADINDGVVDAGNPDDPIISDPEDPQLVLSRRCGHLHRFQCQALYMSTFQDEFPLTPEGTKKICSSTTPGCLSCQEAGQSQSANLHSTILHNLTYSQRTRSYMPELSNDYRSSPQRPHDQPSSGRRETPVRREQQPQHRGDRRHTSHRNHGQSRRERQSPPRRDRPRNDRERY